MIVLLFGSIMFNGRDVHNTYTFDTLQKQYSFVCNSLPLSCHDVWVCDGMSDCDVSVHGDDDQVQDAGGAGPHVHGKPDEAEVAAEDPCVQDLSKEKSIKRIKAKVQVKSSPNVKSQVKSQDWKGLSSQNLGLGLS